jgi:hypothetical protein
VEGLQSKINMTCSPQWCIQSVMSLAELKEQASALSLNEQAELAAYLAERLRRDDPAYRKELARLIDDHDPAHWVRWSDVKSSSGD